jgi:hypothetical protein
VRAAAKLKLSFSKATAQLFLHRYYAVKSLQRNDRFIIACACVYLAAKVEDEQRALADVAEVCFRVRCGACMHAAAGCAENQRAALAQRECMHARMHALARQLGILAEPRDGD